MQICAIYANFHLTLYKYFAEDMVRKTFFAVLAALVTLCSCSRDRYVELTGYAQGGIYSVKLNLRGVSAPKDEIAAAVDSLLEGIDNSLSGYNKGSLLSRYNAGQEIEPDRFWTEINELSDKYSGMTGGAFDVAGAPLFDIWGFGFTTDSLPSPDAVSAALEQCRRREKLNFNAIAQGYSCDVIAEYLHSVGVKDMLVNIGEIYCEGLNPRGEDWSIGIDTPFDGNYTPGASLSGIWRSRGRACGIVTSGNYRKFYIKDGRKYAHTIDPRTGYPVGHSLLSATVVAPTAAEADALATACMVLGPDAAREFIESHDGLEACLISADSTWTSPGF